jgi:Aspartyl/Asparaginyl beta-hydroxylase
MGYTRTYPWQILTRLAGLTLAYRLPFEYDPARLQDDTARVLDRFGTASHFRRDHHDGGWGAIGLVGDEADPHSLRAAQRYAKTPALACAPYIEAILDSFPCDRYRVRLMRLAAGKNIFWHFDSTEHMEGHRARLHIPVVTNPGVAFQISHENMRWGAGEFWYGDFSFPHRVYNGGGDDRIHLVVDLEINGCLRGTIPKRMAEQVARRKRIRRWAQRLCDRYTRCAPYMPDRLRGGIGREVA